MTYKSLEMLKWLLEDLETDEGVCYKTRSSTCVTACPLWYAGAFGVDFVGTVLIVGTKGDEFCDVPEADFLMDHLREEHKNID